MPFYEQWTEDVLTPREMRAREQRAFSAGVCPLLLMEDAARALYARLKPLLRQEDRVLLVCGTGNNGGDGYALARLLLGDGHNVLLLSAGEPTTEDARTMRCYYEVLGGQAIDCGTQEAVAGAGAQAADFRPDCVVDALFGTGFHGAPEGVHAALIRLMNGLNARVVLAVDVPSGLDGATGHAAEDPATGDAICVRATHTVTLGAWKTGLLSWPDPRLTGELGLAPLLLPGDAPCDIGLIRAEALAGIPPRAPDTHKGTAGRMLLYMGSVGMAGAAAMAARAALRAGAGLVTVACPAELITVLQTLVPNAMCMPAERLLDAAPAHDALAAGCGLGRGAAARDTLLRLLEREQGVTVLDADALNLLAAETYPLPERTVLTPHPAEAARLLRSSVEAVLADPIAAARTLAERCKAVVLLKGHVSFVSDGRRVLVQRRGGPALAKGGSGDALAGVLAALCADRKLFAGAPEGERLMWLAALASLWMGLAGERAQLVHGDRSALTAEVVDLLPEALRLSD